VNDERRIVLSEDDFDDETETTSQTAGWQVPQPAPEPIAPQRESTADPALPPVVRRAPARIDPGPQSPQPQFQSPPFPPAYAPRGRMLNSPRVAGPLAALVGIVLAWGVAELLDFPMRAYRATSESGVEAYIGLWLAVLTVLFVAVLVGLDRAVGGAGPEAISRVARSLIPSAILGFLAGFAGEAIVIKVEKSASYYTSPSSARFYLAQAACWALFGLAVGIVLGIIDRSPKTAVNGAVGGLVGGALGGLVFQVVNLHPNSMWTFAHHLGMSLSYRGLGHFSDLMGLLAVGLLVALVIGLIGTIRRDSWLRVISGRMAGREFTADRSLTRVGSAPQCEISLAGDPAIEPLHAQIEERGRQRSLRASPAAPVLVNGTSTTSYELKGGETIQIGGTTLVYFERFRIPYSSI
jgi:hypothetical protein